MEQREILGWIGFSAGICFGYWQHSVSAGLFMAFFILPFGVIKTFKLITMTPLKLLSLIPAVVLYTGLSIAAWKTKNDVIVPMWVLMTCMMILLVCILPIAFNQ